VAAELAENRVVSASDGPGVVREVAGCGRIVGRMTVMIVDPETCTRCGIDEIGEIWISDPAVARGYWQNRAETDRTFRAFLTDTGEGPFLRTGDLGFIQDGELYITSRIKDLIIVAGTNHSPQDIEWTVERSHPAVRSGCVAAFAIQVDGEERLALAVELERGASTGPKDVQDILDSIRRAVTLEHELHVHAVLLLTGGSLPKTASGKIQRHGCWRLLEESSSNVLASWIGGIDRSRPGEPLGTIDTHSESESLKR
jgi:acyl-CoA synthetase (AMP-forming)/AMP-acid ligase II